MFGGGRELYVGAFGRKVEVEVVDAHNSPRDRQGLINWGRTLDRNEIKGEIEMDRDLLKSRRGRGS